MKSFRIIFGVAFILMNLLLGTNLQAQTFSYSNTDTPSKYWYIPQTTRPQGTTTQYLIFWFYSSNFFAHAPGAHFAIGIRGGLSPPISGRGITLGHTELAGQNESPPSGCNQYISYPPHLRPGMSQIENFFPGGNKLFRSSCRPFAGYSDNNWYRVTIHANDTHWTAFWIDDFYGNRIDAGFEPAVQDTISPFDQSLTGLFIVYSGDGGVTYGGNWNMSFYVVNHGWF